MGGKAVQSGLQLLKQLEIWRTLKMGHNIAHLQAGPRLRTLTEYLSVLGGQACHTQELSDQRPQQDSTCVNTNFILQAQLGLPVCWQAQHTQRTLSPQKSRTPYLALCCNQVSTHQHGAMVLDRTAWLKGWKSSGCRIGISARPSPQHSACENGRCSRRPKSQGSST